MRYLAHLTRAASAFALFMLALPAGAYADTYLLNIDNCTGGCGEIVTVQAVQNGANVDFNVSLSGGAFNNNGQGLNTFDFNFGTTSLTAADVTNISTGYSFAVPGKQDGFGTFLDSINKSGGTDPGPLTFTVLNETLANLTMSTGNGTSVLFAADVSGTNGNTGLIGGSIQTPLPAALPLFAGGLGLIGFAGLRKRRKAARLAVAY
jgi:hypothetical protein